MSDWLAAGRTREELLRQTEQATGVPYRRSAADLPPSTAVTPAAPPAALRNTIPRPKGKPGTTRTGWPGCSSTATAPRPGTRPSCSGWDDYHRWDGVAWVRVPDSELDARIAHHCRQVFEADYPARVAADVEARRQPKLYQVTAAVKTNVRVNLSALANHADTGADPPFWLRGGDGLPKPAEVIAAPNGLFTLTDRRRPRAVRPADPGVLHPQRSAVRRRRRPPSGRSLAPVPGRVVRRRRRPASLGFRSGSATCSPPTPPPTRSCSWSARRGPGRGRSSTS